MANAVTTDIARQKMCKARAGDITLPTIVSMVFGDGGVGNDGTIIAPLSSDTALKNEVFRKDIENYVYPIQTTCRYSTTLLKNEAEGKNINEIGLIDSDGDLIAIKTFGNKYKDSDMEMVFQIDDEF
ncbi:phage tail protein [Clostridioides difficile]|nr:phage tail protein [Clostridioides difficile]HBF3087244.1 phage tail protein [Clostridioides difficile]